MKAEDLQTNYINIGPVNKVLNMLSAYLGKLEDVGEGRDVPVLLAHNANVERCSIWQ